MAGNIDRYLVGLPRGNRRVFLGWRLLSSDAPDTPFYVERGRGGKWQRISAEPIMDSTNYLDTAPAAAEYEYRIATPDGATSESVRVDAGAPATLLALDAPLVAPKEGARWVGIADLNNDGRMDYVVSKFVEEEFCLYAYRHDGKPMWNFATGLPRAARDIPFVCYDVNGDGRTEVVTRRGNLGWADELAMARRGQPPPEYPPRTTPLRPEETLVALDGETGEVVWEVPLSGHKLSIKMMAAHIRGIDQAPAVMVEVGTYSDVWLTAYDGAGGKILWRDLRARGGGHNIDAADIDADGIQEVIAGGTCYNGDGTVRWQAEPFGHTDISKPARIDPDREGMQIWYAVERDNAGVYFVDKDGHTIFKEKYRHAHFGWVARHTVKHPGLQPHTAQDARKEDSGMRETQHNPIFLPDGSHWLNLTEFQRKNFMPVHWDEGPEVVFIIRKENKHIVRLKEDGSIEDLPNSKLPEGGEYGRNLGCVDVVGDFRENIVALDSERNHLVVLVNPNLAHRRGYSPYDNFEYGHDRSQYASGYYLYLSPPETTV